MQTTKLDATQIELDAGHAMKLVAALRDQQGDKPLFPLVEELIERIEAGMPESHRRLNALKIRRIMKEGKIFSTGKATFALREVEVETLFLACSAREEAIALKGDPEGQCDDRTDTEVRDQNGARSAITALQTAYHAAAS